jgi:dsRNA-specific ribonuclease
MYKQQVPVQIIEGNHKELKPFLYNLLREYPELSKKNIEKILSDSNMTEFRKAFTSPNAYPNFNYEFYEMLGDSTANNCVVWYFHRRFFPEAENITTSKGTMTPLAIMSRLKQEGASVRNYSDFAEKLGFLPYITMTNIEALKPNKVLEDVFESFIGCLVYHCDKIFGLHIGFTVTYPIIKKLFDNKDISIDKESLYDAKSILNEDITNLKDKIKFEYIHFENKDAINNPSERFKTKAVVTELNTGINIQTPEFTGPKKSDNEQKAAKYLLNMNIFKKLKSKYI